MPTKPPSPLTQQERRFSRDIGQATGFDPRVIYAWIVQEGAYAPHGVGGLNFLNLSPEKGDPYSSVSAGGFERFSSLAAAEAATAHRIRQIVLHEPNATYNVPGKGGPGEYTLAEHTTPASQIGYIAASNWDAGGTPGDLHGHYGGAGGPLLLATYRRLFGGNSLARPAQQVVTPAEATPSRPAGSTTTQPSNSAADWTSYDLTDLAKTPGALLKFLEGLLGSLGKYVLRGLQVVAGAILIILGILMLGRAATATGAARQVRGAVT